MRVFAHRGLPEGGKGCGSNTASDFIRAFQAGYDMEMDLRRWHGRIYVSHDPIMALDQQQSLAQFFDLLCQHSTRMALIGLKEDGLGKEVYDLAVNLGVKDRIVVFDNSVPDLVWNDRNIPSLQQMPRSSDYEKAAWRGGYVLLDHFKHESPDEFHQRTTGYVRGAKSTSKVVLIGPEIHQDTSLWNMAVIRHDLRRLGLWGVITDEPREWMKESPSAP